MQKNIPSVNVAAGSPLPKLDQTACWSSYCDGQHHGKVHLVQAFTKTEDGTPGLGSMEFDFCDKAIHLDRARGYKVEVYRACKGCGKESFIDTAVTFHCATCDGGGH